MQHVQTHTYLQLNPATDSFNTWPAAQQCQEQLLSGLLCKVVGCCERQHHHTDLGTEATMGCAANVCLCPRDWMTQGYAPASAAAACVCGTIPQGPCAAHFPMMLHQQHTEQSITIPLVTPVPAAPAECC